MTVLDADLIDVPAEIGAVVPAGLGLVAAVLRPAVTRTQQAAAHLGCGTGQGLEPHRRPRIAAGSRHRLVRPQSSDVVLHVEGVPVFVRGVLDGAEGRVICVHAKLTHVIDKEDMVS